MPTRTAVYSKGGIYFRRDTLPDDRAGWVPVHPQDFEGPYRWFPKQTSPIEDGPRVEDHEVPSELLERWATAAISSGAMRP